ncbi:hypothetical protein [Muribaculum sp. An289]|nr:hypothetical protein [Muribaculum sp. An289]
MAFVMDRINNAVVNFGIITPESGDGGRHNHEKDLLTMSAEEFWKHIESLRKKFNKQE